jgi:AraC-like DNA-binding protein
MTSAIPAARNPQYAGATHAILLRAKQTIDRHLCEPELTPGKVAKFIGISLRYLQTLFAACGETPTRYIRLRRLQHCCEDFINPAFAHQSIAEISLRWGFADPAYFSRIFKQSYGLAPSLFRNERDYDRFPFLA